MLRCIEGRVASALRSAVREACTRAGERSLRVTVAAGALPLLVAGVCANMLLCVCMPVLLAHHVPWCAKR